MTESFRTFLFESICRPCLYAFGPQARSFGASVGRHAAEKSLFVGPQDYYKVVIDDFDGKTIKAWHLEDKKGNKTDNLAGRSQGLHIDAVVGDKCRSTAHFFSRVNSALLREATAAAAKK